MGTVISTPTAAAPPPPQPAARNRADRVGRPADGDGDRDHRQPRPQPHQGPTTRHRPMRRSLRRPEPMCRHPPTHRRRKPAFSRAWSPVRVPRCARAPRQSRDKPSPISRAPSLSQRAGSSTRSATGLGHSFPVVGAALAGGGAGTAVGGPIGGIAGGALGVGAMSAFQDLAPTYAAARQQGMSHDEAFDYSIKHAAASGLIGAATAPLFALAPFKGFVGKLLFNSFVTQPAAGAATRVGVPLATGDQLPTPGELARGYGEDVASGVAFGVGHEVYGLGKRAVTGRPTAEPGPGEPAPEQPPPEPEPSPPIPGEPGPPATAQAEPATPPAPPAAPEGPVPVSAQPVSAAPSEAAALPREPPAPGPVVEPPAAHPTGGRDSHAHTDRASARNSCNRTCFIGYTSA